MFTLFSIVPFSFSLGRGWGILARKNIVSKCAVALEDIKETGNYAQVGGTFFGKFQLVIKCYKVNIPESRFLVYQPPLLSHPNISIFISIFCQIADIDECTSSENNECGPNALCSNTEGSYVCRCLSGYQGDGKNCTGKYL